MSPTDVNHDAWPELPYEAFKSTAHLLHMCTQMLGKLKLHTPFEPHWSNVALWLTSRGLTTGPVPFQQSIFSWDLDMIDHQLILTTSHDAIGKIGLTSMSVADIYAKLTALLREFKIDITINTMPQEIVNPIAFEKDQTYCDYNAQLAHDWWKILMNSYCIMQQYHARFKGATPPIGLMWGTFDLRDARYNGIPVPTTGANANYIRRNAMDEAQVEIGWWAGNEQYQKPAYFSFMYPQPEKIANAKIVPNYARWDSNLSEFILDYDDLRESETPDKDLLAFFESTYKASAKLANWDPGLIGKGLPA